MQVNEINHQVQPDNLRINEWRVVTPVAYSVSETEWQGWFAYDLTNPKSWTLARKTNKKKEGGVAAFNCLIKARAWKLPEYLAALGARATSSVL